MIYKEKLARTHCASEASESYSLMLGELHNAASGLPMLQWNTRRTIANSLIAVGESIPDNVV
jgi:hypothetical protein